MSVTSADLPMPGSPTMSVSLPIGIRPGQSHSIGAGFASKRLLNSGSGVIMATDLRERVVR